MAASSTLAGGRFQLGERIGGGAASDVYAAVDLMTGRHVAVKLGAGDPAERESIQRRFEREAAALSVLVNPHAVELICAGTTAEGRSFLVLERLTGRNLQEVLADAGTLTPIEVAEWIGQAASALELAHGVGIVHRDLKPENLFLHSPPGVRPMLKVLDFGMVIDLTGPTERGRDAFGGTPLYMAPEQVAGQLTRIGPATDTWALAMIAVALLTGESYWTGTTSVELMREIRGAAIAPPSERWSWLPPAFDRWFLRSTRRVPDRRFLDVAEQAAQLFMALNNVAAPDRRSAVNAVGSASTISARTPTPSIVRMAGKRRRVVGRHVECAELELLLDPGALVTLVGTAGIGKSCLAETVATMLGDKFADGAWFVPLAPRGGNHPVSECMAAVVGITPDNTLPGFDALVAHIAQRETLWVLDGAEQLVGCADEIDRLRRACPRAAWLVTSRLSLDIEGERYVGIEPLDLPASSAAKSLTPGEAATFAVVELLVERAREADPTFVLTRDNVADVVAICHLVDGFPLGIELAAAQLAGSSPARVRAALSARDPYDVAGDPARAPSVRAAVAWSYQLLRDEDQALLRHLAIFPAGLEFEHMRKLFAALVEVPASSVMRLTQSRLVRWAGDDHPRLVMLDTVRELCHSESAILGEGPALWDVVRRHAQTVSDWRTADAGSRERWLRLVDREHDNLLATLAHFTERTDEAPDVAMRLAARLSWYWYLRGHYVDGAARLEWAIERSGVNEGEDLTRALCGAGRLALLSCRYERARALLERGRAIAQARGDVRGEAMVLSLLGSVARELGQYDDARHLHERGLALWQRLGDAREVARARNYLVFAAWLGDVRGDPRDVQRGWWQNAGDIELRALDDPEVVVWSLLNRGAIAHYVADYDSARELLGRAFAESVAAQFHEGIAWALNLIGLTSLERGERLQARAQLSASLRVQRRLGDRWRCASVLESLGAVDLLDGRSERGAIYLGVAQVLREALDAPVPHCERPLLARATRAGEDSLADAFANAVERGRTLTLDDAVDLTRDAL